VLDVAAVPAEGRGARQSGPAAATLPGGFTVLPRAAPEGPRLRTGGGRLRDRRRLSVRAAVRRGRPARSRPGIVVSNLVRFDATRLTADAAVSGAAAAGEDVTVSNPRRHGRLLAGGFTVLDPAPPAPVV